MNKTDGSLKPLQWGPANNSVPHSEKKLQLPFYQAVKRNALPLAALLGNLDKEQHGGICLLDKERGCQQDSECIQVARESACMAMRKCWPSYPTSYIYIYYIIYIYVFLYMYMYIYIYILYMSRDRVHAWLIVSHRGRVHAWSVM